MTTPSSPSSHSSHTTLHQGARGEALAAAFLEARGVQIIQRNYRCRTGEIDLIAHDGDVLCFVEVRTRVSDALCDPLETITQNKIDRIVSAARTFLANEIEGPWPKEMRFDAVGVVLGGGHANGAIDNIAPKIEWVRAAFETTLA